MTIQPWLSSPYRRTFWLAVGWWELIVTPFDADRDFTFWAALARGCSPTDPPPWDRWIPAEQGLLKLPLDIEGLLLL